MSFKAIDCQSFAGGFALGVVQAGFELIGKREQPGGFGVPAMEGNRHLLGYDWQTEACEPDQWTPMKADLVFGNPPCSGFSNMSITFGTEWRDNVNQCMFDLVRYAAKCDPEIVIFESVQNAYRNGRDLMRILRGELEQLTGRKYDLFHVLHNVKHLGGAQDRPRYFFVASRIRFGVNLMNLDRQISVMDRIGDLAQIELGSIEGHEILDSPRPIMLGNLARFGTWNEGETAGEAHERNPEIEIYSTDKAVRGGFTGRRLKADTPSRVIDGGSLERLIHPTEPRAFTFREIARLMGFPDDWKTDQYRMPKSRSKWFGKGICVEAGHWIASAAYRAIEGNPDAFRGANIGEREYLINTKTTDQEETDEPLFEIPEEVC